MPGLNVFDHLPIKGPVVVFGDVPDMRCCQHVVQRAERVIGRQRFDVEHVECGACDVALLQCFKQRSLIDDRAA